MRFSSQGIQYNITIPENKRYVLIEVEGEINRMNAMEYTLKAHEIAAREGIKKFLVDVTRAINNESVGNNFDFAYEDLKNEPRVARAVRVAMLVAPEDHSHDFVETVAINSGENIRLFRDKSEALTYLDAL